MDRIESQESLQNVNFSPSPSPGDDGKHERSQNDTHENLMALGPNARHLFEAEQFESRPKIVKFAASTSEEKENRPQQQELGSFEALMLPHMDAAYNLARWLLRNEDDARDVVQEAYLRAFRSFGGFHGSNGRAWLLTIVRNASYTWMKKNRRTVLAAPFEEDKPALEIEVANPATMLEQNEQSELVRRALDQLPEEFREILVLRHLEGLSYKEIAEVADLAPGTVMSRLARARAKLKEFLRTRSGKEI